MVHSELRDGVNRLITWIGWAMIPTAALLIWAQVRADLGFHAAVQASVAGLVAMVPEGLVLLTSVAFAVSATRLARRRVLTQELAAIEGLARVDVVCLDKTGTLTQGDLELGSVEPLRPPRPTTRRWTSCWPPWPAPTTTRTRACAPSGPARDRDPGWSVTATIPFSSARKWSAATFADHGAWLLGAPDILLAAMPDAPRGRASGLATLAGPGRRVLLVAAAPAGLAPDGEPELPRPSSPRHWWCSTSDCAPRRPTPSPTSGARAWPSRSSPATAPTRWARWPATAAYPAPRTPSTPASCPTTPPTPWPTVVERHSVFGRVTPHQKRAMVHALQAGGHVVAMTGDGVNDTMALKDADVGVAMGAGSAAARAVARFVLLDDDFAVFPEW